LTIRGTIEQCQHYILSHDLEWGRVYLEGLVSIEYD
jgi:hypothetical protein